MESSPLSYKVAPLSTNNSGPHPVIVLLHGRGTDENDLIGLTPSFDPRFLVVSVRAPYNFSYGGCTWFNLDETGKVDIDQLLYSRDALMRCLDDIQQRHCVDPKQIFLFGFSMGAMMSLVLSLSHPNRFKGTVAHSGLLVQDKRLLYKWDDLDKISFFIAHGTYDPIVPVELGRQTHQRLEQAKSNVLYREYNIQHTISEESLNDTAEWLSKRI